MQVTALGAMVGLVVAIMLIIKKGEINYEVCFSTRFV